MANLNGANPNLRAADTQIRRLDAIDDLLVIGRFANVSASTNGAGAALALERIGRAAVAIAYASYTATGSNYWTIEVRVADNASYTDEVTVASVRLPAGRAGNAHAAIDSSAIAAALRAAAQDTATHVRAVATKTGTPGNLTATVHLTE